VEGMRSLSVGEARTRHRGRSLCVGEEGPWCKGEGASVWGRWSLGGRTSRLKNYLKRICCV